MKYGKLSVVMPAYNEGRNIFKNLMTVNDCLKDFCQEYEIIAVNDGSKDQTGTEIARAALKDNHIKAVSYKNNRGKGHAIREGVDVASGDIIAFLDADLDISPSHLKPYLNEMERQGADIVIGSKMHKDSKLEYPKARRFVSFCYYVILKFLFRLDVKDTQTGIKVFKADMLKRTIGMVRTCGYAYDIEILAVAARFGCKIIEQPVELKYTRRESFGRISLQDIFKVASDTLRIFFWLKVKKRYDTAIKTKMAANERDTNYYSSRGVSRLHTATDSTPSTARLP